MKKKNKSDIVLMVSSRELKQKKNQKSKFIMVDLTAWDPSNGPDDIQASIQSIKMQVR